MTAKVRLKPRKAKPFWFGEPWVFDGSIENIRGGRDAAAGDVVEVLDDRGRLIGRGFYNPASVIRVRLVTFGDQLVDGELIGDRLGRAIELRRDVLSLQNRTDVYRVVHAEGDGLPGLIVDRMGDHLVVQFDTAGLAPFRELILDRLEAAFEPRSIHERISKTARDEEGLGGEEGTLRGEAPDGPIELTENGVRHLVDFQKGQKTGFYSDQRDNRMAVAALCRDRDVLDCFSYTGGFSFAALVHGQARHATAVDSSKPALELAEKSAALNGVQDRFTAQPGNVLRVLDHLRKEDPRYDVVILDPPKFVPRKKDLRRGIKLYYEVNHKALRVLKPGGVLATASCSQAVTPDDLQEVVAQAAHDLERPLQLLHRGEQSADHPVMLPHEESAYLKMFVFRCL